jgi:hypothetical protein
MTVLLAYRMTETRVRERFYDTLDYRVVIDWQRGKTPEVLFIRRVGHR